MQIFLNCFHFVMNIKVALTLQEESELTEHVGPDVLLLGLGSLKHLLGFVVQGPANNKP